MSNTLPFQPCPPYRLRVCACLLGAFVLRTLHVENTLLGLAFGYARVSMLLGTLGNAHVACSEYSTFFGEGCPLVSHWSCVCVL
jgi:hypothetical protein